MLQGSVLAPPSEQAPAQRAPQPGHVGAFLDWLDRQSLRRPLALAAPAFIAGLALPIAAAVAAIAAIAVRRRALVVLAAAALSGWLRGKSPDDVPPIAFGMPGTFHATVERAFEADPTRPWKARESILDLDDPPVRVLARGRFLPPSTAEGDRVEVVGALAPLPEVRATSGFDLRRWLDSQGVHAIVRLSADPRRLPASRSPFDRLRRMRRVWGDRLTEALDDGTSSRLARSILLGDRAAVSGDSERAFRATGTNHVLVASGMNVMLLAGVIAWVLSRARAPRPAVRTALLLLTLAYAVVAGADAPIVRAAVALSAWLVAEAIGRPPDGLNLLGLAALVLVAADPGSAESPAFQLSFAAVASLILLTPPLLGRRSMREEEPTLGKRLREGAARLLAANVAAWVGTAPLVVFHFGTVAPIALAANLVVAPLVWLVLTTSLAVLAWQALPVATPWPLAMAVVLPSRALDGFVRTVASIPGGCLALPSPGAWAVVACYAALLSGAALARRRGRKWFAAGAALGAAALAIG